MISGQCGCNSWYEQRRSLVDAKRKYKEPAILVLKYEDLVQAKSYSVECGETKIGVYEYNKFRIPADSFYEGFDVTRIVEHMDAFEKMEIRDDDVTLLAYPKSGSHLVREIVHMLQVGRIEYISNTLDFPIEYRKITEMDNLKSPRMLHSHLWYRMLPKHIREESRGKIIALFRNPKDVAVSFWHFWKNIFETEIPLDDFVDLYITGQTVCNSWYEWRSSFVEAKRKYGELPILVLKYEDLVHNLVGEIQKIAKYMCKTASQEFIDEIVKACEISKMRSEKEKTVPSDVAKLFRDTYKAYYRKGMVGEWKTTLPRHVNAALDQWIASQAEDECDEFPNYRNYYKDQ